MKRLLTLPLLLLASCGIVAPARDNAQWQTSTHNVSVTWRATTPGGLGHIKAGRVLGHASWFLAGTNCVVDIDLAQSRAELARVAAHEYGHCAQARYLLPGIPRPDLRAYTADPREGYAETYALTYLAACGDSLRPLGWTDYAVPLCAEAPDPRSVRWAGG